MADNVGYTPGSGEIIATDDIGGVQYQRVKPVLGTDGVANDVNANTPLPIQAIGELMEAIEAMRMAIQSLNRTIGLAQVNPLTGRMLVDGSGVTQPVSGTVSVGTPAVTVAGSFIASSRHLEHIHKNKKINYGNSKMVSPLNQVSQLRRYNPQLPC